MIDLTLFFDSSGEVAMATNFAAQFADQPSFSTLVLQNGLKYRNIDEQIGSADYLSTSCTNLVNSGPLIQRLRQ